MPGSYVYIYAPGDTDYDDTYQDPPSVDRYDPSMNLISIEVGNKRWAWLPNKRIVRSALCWFLQAFFAQWTPAKDNYPYNLQRRKKVVGTVQIVSEHADITPAYPQIVVSTPVETVRSCGFGDYGTSDIVESLEGEPYVEHYNSKYEYDCRVIVRGDLEEVEEIQAFLGVAFGLRPLKDKFTEFTGGLYLDTSRPVDHGSVTEWVYGGGASGEKMFEGSVSFGILCYGGVRYEFKPEVIQDIFVHLTS